MVLTERWPGIPESLESPSFDIPADLQADKALPVFIRLQPGAVDVQLMQVRNRWLKDRMRGKKTRLIEWLRFHVIRPF